MLVAEKLVTLYHPEGTRVEVTEARAAVLRARGYTERNPLEKPDRNEAPVPRGPGRPRKE